MPNTLETEPQEDPKETIRRQMILDINIELDKETDVNLATQRDDIHNLEALSELKTPRTARRKGRTPNGEPETKQLSLTAR